MTEVARRRHILPCRHKGAQKRIYVVWNGDQDGQPELEEAMRRFRETSYDPEASPSEHFQRIVDFLVEAGFEQVKA